LRRSRLASENDFVLVVAWLLGALRAGGPYPVLAIAGEQGSAKTVSRSFCGPSVAPVRALPRDGRELFIAANNGHVLAFDNLSGLPPWLSDTLCRLSSGGAFSTRRLFTDQDEILFAAARPVILNGIEDIITRPVGANRSGWPKSPRALAGRLRRAQTFLRTLGIGAALNHPRPGLEQKSKIARNAQLSWAQPTRFREDPILIVQTLLTVLTQKSRTRQALKC
jgi:hypothetical protein